MHLRLLPSSLPTPIGGPVGLLVAAATVAALASGIHPAAAQSYSWFIRTADPLYSSGWSTSLALDAAGHPRVGEWAPSSGVRYAVFDGVQWSVETVPLPPSANSIVDPAGARGAVSPGEGPAEPANILLLITTATSLALDAQGDPWIAWVTTDEHNSVTPSKPVHVSHRSGGTWTTEDLEPGVRRPDVAADGAGRVHVCYMRGTVANHDLRYAVRDAGGWTYQTVDANGGEAALRLDAQGVPHIVYLDEARDVLVLAVRTGAAWDTTTVPTPHHPADFSFALDPAGQARIAAADYVVAYETTLQYLEQQSNSWRVTSANPSTSLKVELSLALDARGNPVIAYNDQDGLDLKLSTRVGEAWTSTIVDAQGNTGYYASVAVDAASRPIVSYKTADGGGSMLVATGTPTVDVGAGGIPVAWQVTGPLPNPVHLGAPFRLGLDLPAATRVRLEAFDMSGRRVAERAPQDLGAGRTTVDWSPRLAEPGVYLLRISTGAGPTLSKRFAVVR